MREGRPPEKQKKRYGGVESHTVYSITSGPCHVRKPRSQQQTADGVNHLASASERAAQSRLPPPNHANKLQEGTPNYCSNQDKQRETKGKGRTALPTADGPASTRRRIGGRGFLGSSETYWAPQVPRRAHERKSLVVYPKRNKKRASAATHAITPSKPTSSASATNRRPAFLPR